MLSVFFASCASTKKKAEAEHQLHNQRSSRDAVRERPVVVAAGRETGESMIRGNQTAVWMQHARAAAQAAWPAGSNRVPAPWMQWRALATWTGFLAMTSAPSGARSIHTIDPRTGRGGSLGRRLYV
jgi:hypothetical protein